MNDVKITMDTESEAYLKAKGRETSQLMEFSNSVCEFPFSSFAGQEAQ